MRDVFSSGNVKQEYVIDKTLDSYIGRRYNITRYISRRYIETEVIDFE